jgi:hypothetical protein
VRNVGHRGVFGLTEHPEQVRDSTYEALCSKKCPYALEKAEAAGDAVTKGNGAAQENRVHGGATVV